MTPILFASLSLAGVLNATLYLSIFARGLQRGEDIIGQSEWGYEIRGVVDRFKRFNNGYTEHGAQTRASPKSSKHSQSPASKVASSESSAEVAAKSMEGRFWWI